MSRIFPEVQILKNGEVVGVLDVRSTNFHIDIHADRAVSYGEVFQEDTPYQLVITNWTEDGRIPKHFVKEFCAKCNTEHYVTKFTADGTNTLDIKLLRNSTPYPLDFIDKLYIYQDIKFIYG